MKVLDLFSGIGGFSLGLERAGFETVAFCEIEEFPRKVLAKHWPDVSIYKDIRALRYFRSKQLLTDKHPTIPEEVYGPIDVVCGGFPCQPFSHAGKRAGAEDDRALWPEMLRVIREVQPTWVIGENVIGLESMGLEQCVSDLESNGFAVQVFDIPACGVGAIHRRHRLWIVANANSERQKRKEAFRKLDGERFSLNSCAAPSHIKPTVCGRNDGLPNRMDRVKGLGNAVVPQIPEMIGRAIMEVA